MDDRCIVTSLYKSRIMKHSQHRIIQIVHNVMPKKYFSLLFNGLIATFDSPIFLYFSFFKWRDQTQKIQNKGTKITIKTYLTYSMF